MVATTKSEYKELLHNILQGIVHYPDDIEISERVDNMGVLLSINANQEDLKFIIGKEGSMIGGIRRIIKACGLKNKIGRAHV